MKACPPPCPFPRLQQPYERPASRAESPSATRWSLALCDASCFPIQAMNTLQDLLNSICSLKIATEGFQQELGQLKEDVAQVSGPEGERLRAWVPKGAFGDPRLAAALMLVLLLTDQWRRNERAAAVPRQTGQDDGRNEGATGERIPNPCALATPLVPPRPINPMPCLSRLSICPLQPPLLNLLAEGAGQGLQMGRQSIRECRNGGEMMWWNFKDTPPHTLLQRLAGP